METRFVVAIVLVVILIVASITIRLIYRSSKRRREREEQAHGDSSGDSGTVSLGSSGTGVHAGVDYNYKHFRGSDKAAPYFTITVPCVASGSFKVKKETKFDRFFKKLGVCIELQTNDPEFDDAFYITTNAIPFTRSALGYRENRQSIREMFKLRFNSLTFKDNTVTLTWQSFPRKKEMETAVMEAAVAQMAVLAGNLPKVSVPEEMEKPNWKRRRFAAFALPGFLLLSGIVLLIIGVRSYRPLDHGKIFGSSLMYSMPLLLFFSWVALQLVKGRSTSHYELIVIVLLALFAFPLAGDAYTVYLNGAMDTSPESVYETRVNHKYYTRSKSNYTYYMVVTSWRETEETEKIKISKYSYNRLKRGTRVTVTTKPGKFGYEWLVGFR